MRERILQPYESYDRDIRFFLFFRPDKIGASRNIDLEFLGESTNHSRCIVYVYSSEIGPDNVDDVSQIYPHA